MHKEVTNKQIQQALREKTYETINAFSAKENNAEELVRLHYVIQQLVNTQSQGNYSITNRQLALALREKTYEALTAFDPAENAPEELVHLQFVVDQLKELPNFNSTETPAV